jgi:hypothetical protein
MDVAKVWSNVVQFIIFHRIIGFKIRPFGHSLFSAQRSLAADKKLSSSQNLREVKEKMGIHELGHGLD